MNENDGLINEDMLDRLIELAIAKPLPQVKIVHAKPVLGEGEYLVHVDYTVPSFDELKREFGRAHVSSAFDGRPFEKHSSCADIDETPGERVMIVRQFDGEIGTEDAIRKMDESGYRPATHLELYAFQKANPDLLSHFWIVALGSYTMTRDYDHRRCVAVLNIECALDYNWFNSVWGAVGRRFLFVRK